MPAGETQLAAHTVDGGGFVGKVVCDSDAAGAIQDSFLEFTRAGQRVWIDLDHSDSNAAGWIKNFRWDPRRGIVARVEWTRLGEQALRDKEFFSFSPAFMCDRFSGRITGLIPHHAAGGLTNSPAFGASMPALVAARMISLGEMQKVIDGISAEIETLSNII